MRGILGVALMLAAPVAAQTTATPSQLASNAFAREEIAASELNRHDGVNGGRSGNDVPSSLVLRAGAWGRCVVGAAPALARVYVETKSADPALKPVFRSCLRRTGDFQGSNWGDVRRAALSDALAPPR